MLTLMSYFMKFSYFLYCCIFNGSVLGLLSQRNGWRDEEKKKYGDRTTVLSQLIKDFTESRTSKEKLRNPSKLNKKTGGIKDIH